MGGAGRVFFDPLGRFPGAGLAERNGRNLLNRKEIGWEEADALGQVEYSDKKSELFFMFPVDILKENHKVSVDLIRVAVRFFSGVPHPHLLGVCCPNLPSFSKYFLEITR